MEKKNWFDTFNDMLPANRNTLGELIKNDPLFSFNNHLKTISDFMTELDGFGFQDKGRYYEMVTNLGGTEGGAGAPEDSVKVQLKGKYGNVVEITYEHKSGGNENAFYSHSQKTSVTLPPDSDKDTLEAHFDEQNNVVVTVKKQVVKTSGKTSRNIPIEGK